MRRGLALVVALLVVAAVNWKIMGSERTLREGQLFYLELAPVDPRSIMQGDYMVLNYAVANELRALPQLPSTGLVQLSVDPDGVARRPQLVTQVRTDSPGQIVIGYRKSGWQVLIGTDAYFFEEGQGQRYQPARYGVFRSDGAGHALLTGLVDAQFKPL